jgi:hypothetical protein
MFGLVTWALLAAAAVPAPERVAQFSSSQNDYNPSFDAAERVFVFARSRAEFQQARIYVSQRRGRAWSTPAPIAFADPRYSDTDPWLTPDGQTLYFISDRPTPSGPAKKDLDVWRARRTAGGWTAPEHLGDRVNSSGPELGVEYHAGILYFASVRKGGRGGLDIYASREGADGFGAATPLGEPFNGAQSDSDFTMSADGRVALFWRGDGQSGIIHASRLTAAGWSAPLPVKGAAPGRFNFTPALSRDGRRLWFASTAPRPGQAEGMADIFVVKLRDRFK